MDQIGEGLSLRRARPDDGPELRAMQAHSLRVLGAGHYSAAQIETILSRVGTMDDFLLHEGTYYVAVQDGSIVGSGGWSRREPHYAAVTGPTDGAGPFIPKIRSVFVHPAWARRGVARRLVGCAEAEAGEAGYGTIELMAMLAGVPLYEKLGYEAQGTVAVALPDGIAIPVVPMCKTLQRSASRHLIPARLT